MKPLEFSPKNKENAEQSVSESTLWDSLATIPFRGDADKNMERVRRQAVPDETATLEEQANMQNEQEKADRNENSNSPTGKDFENYVDDILNRR